MSTKRYTYTLVSSFHDYRRTVTEKSILFTDTAGLSGNGDSNSEFVIIVVCASVGGFTLAVIITVIIIVVAILRTRRKRHEAYSLTVTAYAQRASQIGKYLTDNYSYRRVHSCV